MNEFYFVRVVAGERQRDRQTDRQTDTDRDKDRETETERDRQTERECNGCFRKLKTRDRFQFQGRKCWKKKEITLLEATFRGKQD